MMEKLQFDELLGGNVQLPREVPILRLAAARANEIAAMTYSIENPQQSKLVFQKLPTHMRRRVMSHNAKRMPRRLREAHLKQMAKSGLPPVSKRPSRKHRRRPKCLQEAYARRDARCVWLRTHIWHAKRFHMIEKWGHKIADRPNDKSFRACYRAIAAHCLLRDLSYYACLELGGPDNYLRENLKRHCNPGELSFGAKIYRQGSREGSLMFFKKDSYPRAPIGRVNFMWKPGNWEFKTLWIWVHPLVYKDFYREIVTSFGFRDDNRNDKGCVISNLRNSLSRFRLTGPLSLAILTDALRVPNLSEDSIGRGILDDSAKSVDSADNASAEWVEKFYACRENLESLRMQKEMMDALKSLKSPSQLPPNSIMSATVLDPRFFLPQKRTKTLANAEIYQKMMTPLTPAHQSPLWDTELRTLADAGCKTTREINKLRSENLVPGVGNDDKYDENIMSKVPVIIIQNPGCNDHNKSIGFASGVDVIVPAKWSMPFWQSFVYRCARAGGLRESRSVAYEKLDLNSPEMHQPDIPSYDSEALATMNQLRAKYFRYPPNRRVNYTKFAITSPFRCEWRILMKEWTDSDEFHVMRDRQLLEILRKALLHNPKRGKNKNVNGRKIVVGGELPTFDKSQFESRDCLIPVRITIEGRGRPRNFAIICAATTADLTTRAARPKWSGPVQEARSDPNERERRTMRKDHKIRLKRSNKRGHRWRKVAREAAEQLELQKRSAKATKIPVDRNFALKSEYREAMENLYLPKCEAVRRSCDREVMGFVTRGDFSFSEARGVGVGYVALEALLSLAEGGNDLVLVRNPQSRQYRLAKIEVLNQYR